MKLKKKPSITDLATTTALNAKINMVKNKIPAITNLRHYYCFYYY